jgi:putative sterol carrier protein
MKSSNVGLRGATGLVLVAWAAAAAAQEPSTGAAQPPLMSPEWAKEACDAWNKSPVLTGQLVESGWMDNDGGRGYKVLHVYRRDCKDSHPVELKIAKKDKKAMCVYGGAPEVSQMDPGKDYVMFADTPRWQEMGRGDYGPMRAMMFGRLQFQGPKWEAMRNMTPFADFLLLTGKVPANPSVCPQ